MGTLGQLPRLTCDPRATTPACATRCLPHTSWCRTDATLCRPRLSTALYAGPAQLTERDVLCP